MNGIRTETKSLPRVLLVENDKPSVDVTRYFLKEICSIDVAENGETALELVKQSRYSLILMDINLGRGISGIEAARQIKNNNNYLNTAIVALTAYAGPNDKANFLASGLTHYLAKPFNKAAIINLVKSILDGDGSSH